jgi:16S rRNA (guanine527-N7)-methyltransferase
MEEKLQRLAEWSVGLEISGTAISSVDDAWDRHIRDSLVGADVPVVAAASRIVDIGSGAGFPGLVLGVALPDTEVVLVDSVRKKMQVAARIAEELELSNVECVWGRVEEISRLGSPHREAYDVVTARALAPLAALLEYAAPLLRVGGSLVAWKGAPSDEELVAAESARSVLGYGESTMSETRPFSRSRSRHFYLAEKLQPVEDRFPRKPGIALKRPLS